MTEQLVWPPRPYEGLGNFLDRSPMPAVDLAAGFRLVSADNHLAMGGCDWWYDHAPAHLRDRVPRVRYDDDSALWITSIGGKNLYPHGSERFHRSMEGNPGAWNVEVRVAEMAMEGVEKEIVFPHLLGFFFHHADFEVRECIFRLYNEYLAELQARCPGKFYGVGIPNYWDEKKAPESIYRIKQLGLKTFMLPSVPGLHEDGTAIRYSDVRMEPLWRAATEVDLPVCFHTGEAFISGGRGVTAIAALEAFGRGTFGRNFGELVFGGILDREPSLRIVFAEGGLAWVPPILVDADMVRESFGGLLDYETRMKPSEYWAQHCYATFMHDPIGLMLIDHIGRDKAMWAVDYPHNESTFGYSGTIISDIVAAVGEPAAHKILGQTAIDLFRLD